MLNTQLNSLSDEHNVRYSYAAISSSPNSLTDIYQDDINLAVWQTALSSELNNSAIELIEQAPNLKIILTLSSQASISNLQESCSELADQTLLCQHILLLVDMFCTLFDLKRVGLRLTVLQHAMCPKFHVDKVPCRLVTTLAGDGTEWLPSTKVNRTKLGAGSSGLSDEESGIYVDSTDIQHLSVGDVALLKGESWINNKDKGLVHRSPALQTSAQRLLLTLDFID